MGFSQGNTSQCQQCLETGVKEVALASFMLDFDFVLVVITTIPALV